MPVFADRVDELKDWDQIKLLTVAVDRLERWHRPGLLCIGDAAHAMSPIGGVGVNLAVQDAVAAANILWQPLKAGTVTEDDLDRVQKRREFPTRVIQRIQVFVQNKVVDRALGADKAHRRAARAAADVALCAAAPHPGAHRRPGRAAGAHAHARQSRRRGRWVTRSLRLIREVFRPELDRRAVRRAVGGVIPGVAIAREHRRVGHALWRRRCAPAR